MLLFNVLFVGRYVWQHKLYAQPTEVFWAVSKTTIDSSSSYFVRIQWLNNYSSFCYEPNRHCGPAVPVISGTNYIF